MINLTAKDQTSDVAVEDSIRTLHQTSNRACEMYVEDASFRRDEKQA